MYIHPAILHAAALHLARKVVFKNLFVSLVCFTLQFKDRHASHPGHASLDKYSQSHPVLTRMYGVQSIYICFVVCTAGCWL
jgi:hypothetical protein